MDASRLLQPPTDSPALSVMTAKTGGTTNAQTDTTGNAWSRAVYEENAWDDLILTLGTSCDSVCATTALECVCSANPWISGASRSATQPRDKQVTCLQARLSAEPTSCFEELGQDHTLA
jgi:hypothetical protein